MLHDGDEATREVLCDACTQPVCVIVMASNMSAVELRQSLEQLGLSSYGQKRVLKERLRRALHARQTMTPSKGRSTRIASCPDESSAAVDALAATMHVSMRLASTAEHVSGGKESSRRRAQVHRYLLIIDFEATCIADGGFQYD